MVRKLKGCASLASKVLALMAANIFLTAIAKASTALALHGQALLRYIPI